MPGGLQGAWETAERGISPPVSCPTVEMGKEVSMGPLDPKLRPALAQWSTCMVYTLHCAPLSPEAPGDPQRARVQGCVLGEVPAASPDHQWLGVRTDVPLGWASINQEPDIGFSLSHTRWAQG